MINPAKLKTFVTEMQQSINTINFSEVVIDDTQLVKFLQALKVEQNHVLMGIIPEYPLEGDQDKIKWKNQMMFMVLQKANSANVTHPEFLTILDDTLKSAKEFVEILISEKSGDSGDFCSITNDLQENSLRISPVWNKAQCHGWSISFDLLTSV
jgi:hypothetical protein